jgi:hypothetical protein
LVPASVLMVREAGPVLLAVPVVVALAVVAGEGVLLAAPVVVVLAVVPAPPPAGTPVT